MIYLFKQSYFFKHIDNMLYIVTESYVPNTASTNRILAYIRAFAELCVAARVIFFQPDSRGSKCNIDFHNIEFFYMWDHHYINIPILKKLSYRYYITKFVRSLRSGDIVYVYGVPDLVVELSKRKDISVFVERTEHNKVFFRGLSKRISIQEFLNACRIINGVVVISHGLRNDYINNGCLPEKVHVVNMIVDTTRFVGLQKTTSEKYIAYCGTASNNKDGVDQLIKAFAIVAKQHSDYKLYIIGKTPSKDQRFENFELVKTLGVEDKVIFTGGVSANEIPQLLKNAAILALDRPDNMQAKYGFPTKLGEYLLTENPVVITGVGDVPLFLKDGESALIAEPDNPQDFANKICWAIEHPTEAKVIGEKGCEIAKSSFNYITETKKLLKIINS